MKIGHYQVGIVAGQTEVTESQLAEMIRRLKFIREHIDPAFKVIIRVAAANLRLPETSISPELRNLTYRIHELQALKAWTGSHLIYHFLYEQLKDCDEIWCCTGAHQTTRAKARAMRLYRYSQEMKDHAARFKIIPHYVETPVEEAKPKGKKGKPWNA